MRGKRGCTRFLRLRLAAHARITVPNFVPQPQINRCHSVTVQRFGLNAVNPSATGVFVLSSDTGRYLWFLVLFAWGACGRRFKSGRPDQSKIF